MAAAIEERVKILIALLIDVLLMLAGRALMPWSRRVAAVREAS